LYALSDEMDDKPVSDWWKRFSHFLNLAHEVTAISSPCLQYLRQGLRGPLFSVFYLLNKTRTRPL
jgi:hypothetical protein